MNINNVLNYISRVHNPSLHVSDICRLADGAEIISKKIIF